MDADFPSAESLILVAVMKNARDLEIARLLGWYRIPLRSAPKVISVDYLAFYQTSTFKENRWQIQFLAPVRGHELTTRLELLGDEPDHPQALQEYYKIQIGPLVRLEKPIIAEQWRRITFFYTTGAYLLKARSINDLIIQSEARQILWQALRERGSKDDYYHPDSLPEADLTPEILAAVLGISKISARQDDAQV